MVDENVEKSKTDDLLFELIKRRLGREWERANNLDNKANTLIGLTSIIIGILLGAVTIKLSSLIQNHYLSIIYFLSIAVLLCVVGTGLGVLKIRKYIDVPNPEYLLKEYPNRPYREIIANNAIEMSKAVSICRYENQKKVNFLQLSWYLLILGLLMMFIFVITYTLVGDLG